MSDYIKREDVISLKNEVGAYGYNISSDEVMKIPAADVRENVRGKWIYYNEPFTDTMCCSECEFNVLPEEAEVYNYCPNCGADTRGAIND